MTSPFCHDFVGFSGRRLAEYVMQSGLVLPFLAGQTEAGRVLWPEGFVGIEAGPRLGRPVSGRGVDRRARARGVRSAPAGAPVAP